MNLITPKKKIQILRKMLESRAGDLREQSLIRQGKGWFHVSAMGHEAMVVVGELLQDGDFFAGYYRDRPIALGRGVTSQEMALSFFAKAGGKSGGRQMPAHFSDKKLGIFSIPSVVGGNLIPAVGLAWGLKLDHKKNAVLATVGDGGTRQGDFFESIAFAQELKLPIVYLVEDNGIGISTKTQEINPLSLGVFDKRIWQMIDGCDVEAVHKCLSNALGNARNGDGPQFIWARTERLSSHSSADDQRKYLSSEELESLEAKDPISRLKKALIDSGDLDETSFNELEKEIELNMRNHYDSAWETMDPSAEDALNYCFGETPEVPKLNLKNEAPVGRMVDAINSTFHHALRKSKEYIFLGQDIEDPKGGVFSLTKGLSEHSPDNVRNAPIAESTIFGVAVGLAAYGKRPVFEIQFVDYIWPGFNQLATHLSTLHWRTNGEWQAPAVIYAPYGAYLPGGALWHSQTNEAAIAHLPGIKIAIPSTSADAAGLFWSAMHENSPCIILIPKHLMWHSQKVESEIPAIPFGKARTIKKGTEVTVVCWANTTEVVAKAIEALNDKDAIEVIDLRSIVPLDLESIKHSILKTKRILVVQEDGASCSIGESIISEVIQDIDLFNILKAPPKLIAKPNVNIGYHPNLEYAVLPSSDTVVEVLQQLLQTTRQTNPSRANPALSIQNQPMKNDDFKDLNHPSDSVPIKVPILGEGITSATVVSLIVKEGDDICRDDPLCELETDKALFPVESSYDGKFLDWLVEAGDEIHVDQEIARIQISDTNQFPKSSNRDIEPSVRLSAGGLSPSIIAQLKDVIPAHMSVKANWKTIRTIRMELKESAGNNAPSPTLMVAWATIRAMEKHPVFCSTTTPNNTLEHQSIFDFGFAVALEDDALETAIVKEANQLNWNDFKIAYMESLKKVRKGKGSSKVRTPLILTSLGGYSVREAQPLVVPPAISTLFLGEAHQELDANGNRIEQVSLCLSFDHRWINGAACANFLNDLRQEIESFKTT